MLTLFAVFILIKFLATLCSPKLIYSLKQIFPLGAWLASRVHGYMFLANYLMVFGPVVLGWAVPWIVVARILIIHHLAFASGRFSSEPEKYDTVINCRQLFGIKPVGSILYLLLVFSSLLY